MQKYNDKKSNNQKLEYMSAKKMMTRNSSTCLRTCQTWAQKHNEHDKHDK